MYRVLPLGSLIVSVAIVLLTVSLPTPVAAVENVCITADTMCTPDKSGKMNPTPCVCAVVGFTITGICVAPQKCQALKIDGVAIGQSGLSSSQLESMGVTSLSEGGVGGTLESIGSFITKNPMVSGMGIGVVTSLLQSMMSGGGGGSSGSGSDGGYGGYGTGICTTQYYYSAS